MPYFQIHMFKGVRSKEEIRKLADVVQECSLKHFNAPPKDRYQVTR
jgi:phenylpyruvate tautomerase PptA (4-oxalocrotonate tautomerase family)